MTDQPAYEEFGGYRLTHLLGKGGMASVYRAVRSGLKGFEKEVAIKRIHDSLTDNKKMIEGLTNEALLGGQLKHPNIVEVYEFNKVGEHYYLALEFVDGWTLDRVLKLSREYSMPIPPAVVLELGRQVCEGLDYAHKLESLDGRKVKLVHRDLKPANIIVSRYGIAKILDFGIAKAATNLYQTTVADVTKGTPHYMSPEQVGGAKDLGAASDLFAIGAVLYELATGKVLFVGDTLPTVLFSVVKAEVGPQIAEAERRIPNIGPILTRLLAKDPANRPPDAAAVAHSLARLLDEQFKDGPSIQQYLYSVRDRMLADTGSIAGPNRGIPVEATRAAVDAGGEPEFATMLAPVVEGSDPELAAVKAAADARLGMGRGFGEVGVDTQRPTVDRMAVPDQEADETAQLMPPVPEPSTPVQTDPNQKATRRVPGPTRRMKKKKAKPRWSAPMLAIAAVLAIVLMGTIGWIVKSSLDSGPEPTPEVVDVDPTPDPAEPPDLDFNAEPTSEPRTPKEPRTPTAVPEPTPAPDTTPASAPDATPAPPDPTPEPTPEATPAPPEPTPEPVAVVPSGPNGFLSIKTSSPYSRVIIDGIPTGKNTPLMRLPLQPGKHTVVLEAIELHKRSKPRSFVITSDQNLKLGHYDFHSDDWSD